MCSGSRRPKRSKASRSTNSTNFEKIKPGDGYGLDYSQSGWKLDVFIYDLKRAAIPEDAKSAIVRAEFERVRADAFLAQPRGVYAQVYLRRNFTIDDAAKRTRFQCAAFHLTRDGAKPQDGYLCVTSWNNKFVKLRFTTLADSNTEAAARKYVTAWIPVLWGRAAASAPSRSSRAEPQSPQPRPQAPGAGARPVHRQRRRAAGSYARNAISARRAEFNPPPPAASRRPHRRSCPDRSPAASRSRPRRRTPRSPVPAAIFRLRRMARRQRAGVRRAQDDPVEERQLQRRRGEARVVRPGDHDLGGMQPQVERVEQRGMLQQVVGARPPARRRTAGRPARAMRRRRSGPRAERGSARRWHSGWAWRRRWSRPAAPPGPRRRSAVRK